MRVLLPRLMRAGVVVSIVFTSTCLLFVLANLAVQGAYLIAIETNLIETNPFLRKYGDAVRKAHPDMEMAELRKLLRETWGHASVYDPVTQFKEPARRSTYVNVDEAGFRHSADQARWPPEAGRPAVFVFGGSTTFGYNVRDAETLVSHLQAAAESKFGIRPATYNFGRGNYSSSEEMLLFARLVFEGHRPDIAIFVDGLNEFQHAGQRDLTQTGVLRQLYDNYDSTDLAHQFPRILAALPITKALNWFAATIGLHHPDTGAAPPAAGKPAVTDPGIRASQITLRLYQENRRIIRAIAKEMGIETVFVWQPIPFYRYDLSHHPFRDTVPIWRAPGHVPGYQWVDARRNSGEMGRDFVWCADIQDGVKRQVYVDSVHYTSAMNRIFADCIVEGLPNSVAKILRGFVTGRGG